MVNCVVVAQEHDIACISEIGHMEVGSNLNSWVILQG